MLLLQCNNMIKFIVIAVVLFCLPLCVDSYSVKNRNPHSEVPLLHSQVEAQYFNFHLLYLYLVRTLVLSANRLISL